jgi:hypothetical protein
MTPKRLRQLSRRAALASGRHTAALAELQAECKHERVIEAPYAPSLSGFFNAMPPFRVCTVCGVTGDGWGCGYDMLATKRERTRGTVTRVKDVTREAAYRLRDALTGVHL